MGKRGPAPTPTEILKRRGSKLVNKRKSDVSPEPLNPEGLPEPPAWMNDDARVFWDWLGHELARMGLLTRLDALSLAALSDKLAMYCAAKATISENGNWHAGKMIAVSENGAPYQDPAVGICNKAWDSIVKLCLQFGMTPSARAGLHVEQKSGAVVDAKERFFK